MEDIEKTLAQMKQNSKYLLNNTRERISKAKKDKSTSQWYMNDLILQESIAKTNVNFAELIERLLREMNYQDRKLINFEVKFDEEKTIEKEIEVVENEENVLRRFRH